MEIRGFVDFNTKKWQETCRLLETYKYNDYTMIVQLIVNLQNLNWGRSECKGLKKHRFDPSEFILIFSWAKAQILSLPRLFPRGLSAYNKSFDLSKLQCVAILSGLVFACTPTQHTFFHKREKEKLDCILSYFRIMMELNFSELQSEILSIEVNSLLEEFKIENWSATKWPLLDFEIDPIGKIEDHDDRYLKVNFSNPFIGGKVLNFGCVQQEILFSIYPELIVSMFFCEKMKPHEAILIKGVRRTANYSGYSFSFKFTSEYSQKLLHKDDQGRISNYFVALDALKFYNIDDQFKNQGLLRELNKAYIGFCKCRLDSEGPLQPVVTGKWGCGRLGGFAPLKILIQWIAASACGRKIIIITLKDETLNELVNIMNMYRGQSIDYLLKLIMENPGIYLFDALLRVNIIKNVPVNRSIEKKIMKEDIFSCKSCGFKAQISVYPFGHSCLCKPCFLKILPKHQCPYCMKLFKSSDLKSINLICAQCKYPPRIMPIIAHNTHLLCSGCEKLCLDIKSCIICSSKLTAIEENQLSSRYYLSCFSCKGYFPDSSISQRKCSCLLCNHCYTRSLNFNQSSCVTCRQQLFPSRKACEICIENFFRDEMITLNCEHYYCKDCLAKYINTQITAGESVNCPNCAEGIDGIIIHSLVSAQVWDNYNKTSIRKNFKLTDCPKCGSYFEVGVNSVTCSNCWHSFCVLCKDPSHGGGCDERKIKGIIEDLESRGQRVAQCPGCKFPYTKDEGCDHVTCMNPQCLVEFCFACSCLREPTIKHGNHYHREDCNFYVEYNGVDTKLNNCRECIKFKKLCPKPKKLSVARRFQTGEN